MPTNQQRRDAAKRKLERQLVRRQERLKGRRQRNIIAGVIVGVLVIAGVIFFVTKKPSATDAASATSGTDVSASATTPSTPCTYTPTSEAAVKAVTPPTNTNPAKTGTVQAVMTVGQGAVPITLDRNLAPCAVNAFISLAEQKFYDGTPCHRLTTDADLKILQCGDPSGTGRGGPGYDYPADPEPQVASPSTDATSTDATGTDSTDPGATTGDTSSATTDATPTDSTSTTTSTPDGYPVGTIAMANVSAGGNNGSQFFIVYGESILGSSGYTKIGTVGADGLAVIQAIAAKGTVVGKNANGALDAPAEPVNITTITVPADAVGAQAPPETTALPTDTVPTDSVPADTVPTDTVPADTVPTGTTAETPGAGTGTADTAPAT